MKTLFGGLIPQQGSGIQNYFYVREIRNSVCTLPHTMFLMIIDAII